MMTKNLSALLPAAMSPLGSYWSLDGADKVLVPVQLHLAVGQPHQNSLEASRVVVHRSHGDHRGRKIHRPQLLPLDTRWQYWVK